MTNPDQSIQDEKVLGLLDDASAARHESSADLRKDLHALQSRVTALEDGVKENTRLTAEIGGDTKELLDLFHTAKGGFRVVGWIGTFAKWLVGLAAGAAAIYTAYQKFRGH